MTISLATEVASAPKYPGKRHNARERKVLETVKTYVDAGDAAVVSDTAYAAGWNGVTAVAPSKNAVYDKVELLNTAIGTKQATLTMGQADTGTGGTVGQVAVAGLTNTTGKVVVTAAENPGVNLVISDVIVSNDYFTVFTKNTDTGARAELDGIAVNYIVISL